MPKRRRNRDLERTIMFYRGPKSPLLMILAFPFILLDIVVDLVQGTTSSPTKKYSSGWSNPWMWGAAIILLMTPMLCSIFFTGNVRKPDEKAALSPNIGTLGQTPLDPYIESANRVKKAMNSVSVAVIISSNANLRHDPAINSPVIREVRFGERLVLKNNKPSGPWYKVWDSASNSEGWIHGNTIRIELATLERSR